MKTIIVVWCELCWVYWRKHWTRVCVDSAQCIWDVIEFEPVRYTVLWAKCTEQKTWPIYFCFVWNFQAFATVDSFGFGGTPQWISRFFFPINISKNKKFLRNFCKWIIAYQWNDFISKKRTLNEERKLCTCESMWREMQREEAVTWKRRRKI